MHSPRPPSDAALREFHVSRGVRDACGLPDTLFSTSGNVVFADFRAAREFAYRLNRQRDLVHFPERAVSASRIYALGLIDEAMHLVIARYREQRAPQLWRDIRERLDEVLGPESADDLLRTFVDEFPPASVYRGEIGRDEYLEGSTGAMPHREVALEELLLLWMANRNRAFAEFRELFDDRLLRGETTYDRSMTIVESELGRAPAGDGAGETLLDLLYAPMRAAPDSLEGQLAFIRARWADLLGPDLHRVLGGLEFLAEEGRVFFGAGPGPVEPPDYSGLDPGVENYSADRDWMPEVVLLAKNAHVWLSQLSRVYGREITGLDGIPDDELATLAGWGVTGLWLIGVWERSRASERIKRMMGDSEAVASAYSLKDYRIAEALGGEPAFEDLRARAWRYGIRLSTDMVPNHMGIDSRWVIEHPHWFLWLDRSPYPAYSFTGPDLSDDDRVGVFIEDGYWKHADAAVVFKRVDRQSGDERYIYHGNDGTSMPWNDTAQLDYTKAEVREGVIRTILAVARRSPIIRFDAAMTLTREHYHRLWFPQPGDAGAVPSRAEFGMSQAAFDAVMPHEFWREVVDRVAAEAPDTLLLAEAFWLLEGYFVRSLGMHRVYNSAFMNMLRDERNAEYRQLIRSTLEFDPQILKRYVNFMSNPDERTAVDQFGTGDKYFGVATMMATLPGLPMLGHGQIEGLAEKYGMEFTKPRWDESPDEGLVRRHEHQLFPLLRGRRAFAEVDRFRLYDFVGEGGEIDENVFAYSNEVDGRRSLVVYHNCYAETHGRVRVSTGVAERAEDGERRLRRWTLAEGLRLPAGSERWLVLPDAASGLEYLRSCEELRTEGLRLDLGAYRLHCFVGLREVVEDAEHPWSALAAELAGGGVPSIDEALELRQLAPVVDPLRRLLSPRVLEGLASPAHRVAAVSELGELAVAEVASVVAAAVAHLRLDVSTVPHQLAMLNDLEAVFALAGLVDRISAGLPFDGDPELRALADALREPQQWAALLSWVVTRRLGRLEGDDTLGERARRRFRGWQLGALLDDALGALQLPEGTGRSTATAVELMLAAERWLLPCADSHDAPRALLEALFADPVGRRFLGVNLHEGVRWFNREAYLELISGLLVAGSVRAVTETPDKAIESVTARCRVFEELEEAAIAAGYQVDDLLDAMPPRGSP
jgi:glycosidase